MFVYSRLIAAKGLFPCCITDDIFLHCYCQGICVVHNFKGTQTTTVKQKPKDPHGVPLMTFPRVESPLETLSAQVSHTDHLTLKLKDTVNCTELPCPPRFALLTS